MTDIMSGKVKAAIAVVVVAFIALVLGLVITINMRSTDEQQTLLEESTKSQLISITLAARDRLDAGAIGGYNSIEDVIADIDNYVYMRDELRQIAADTGADYIYVIKYIDGEANFIFDTDEEDETIFVPYELSQVHLDAFAGNGSAGVMNVEDQWGSYNTAAMPVIYDGKVVAIVCTDINDYYLSQSYEQAYKSRVTLVVSLGAVLCLMASMIFILLSRVSRMQSKLSAMARRDTVTGLPNRQYLWECLEEKTKGGQEKPFALFFIDLDNFKKVNDTAGHDAGDELLRRIADFLEMSLESARVFRPAPGSLNIAARIGGDEFVLAVDGVENAEQGRAVADKLMKDFTSGEFSHYEEKYGLGMSVGIALYPEHTRNLHVLVKYADIAMYHAKNEGRSGFKTYTEEMDPKMEK